LKVEGEILDCLEVTFRFQLALGLILRGNWLRMLRKRVIMEIQRGQGNGRF
jgi:hypothetical protein